MKITAIEVLVLGDPPPPGPVDDTIAELPIVRVHTDEGLIGLSEVFAVPAGVARAVLHGADSFFGRHLLGEDPFPPERLWTRLYNRMLHGNRRGWAVICIGAVEVALWDLCGQALGRPVFDLLAGGERSGHQIQQGEPPGRVVPYATIVSREWDAASVVEQQAAKVEEACDLGFRAVKIEPMRSTPATILELARRARAALGPDRALAVDVGYLWNDVDTALRVAERLAEFDIAFLETPFPVDALAAYQRLSARSPLPLAAGEHGVTRWEFQALMDEGGVRVVQPYVTTVGGLTEARRVVDLALARGALVCPGNWSTQLLGTANLHLAALSPNTRLVEYAPAQIYWSPLRRAIQALAPPVDDGTIAYPTRPGIGIALPDDLLRHFRVG